MRTPLALLLVFVILPVAGGSLEAQAVQPAGRPYRGLFGGGPPPGPGRLRQELVATTDVKSEYGDFLQTPAASPLTRQKPDYGGSANTELRYFLGRDSRSVTTTGQGYTTGYGTTGKPSIGWALQVQGASALGKTNRLSAEYRVRRVPFFTIGAFDSLSDAVDPKLSPDANPMNGLPGYPSWHSDTSVTFGRKWTRHDNIDIRYGYSKVDYQGPLGFDSEVQTLGADYTRALGAAVGLTMTYGRSEQRLSASRRIAQDLFGLEGTYKKRVSRNRELRFAGGAGVIRTADGNLPERTQELNPLGEAQELSSLGGSQELSPLGGRRAALWIPSGHGGVAVNIGRSGGVQVDYRRSVSVLDAITPQPVVVNAVFLQWGTLVGPRLELGLSSGYSAGRDPGNIATRGQTNSRSISAQAQVKYAFARSVSAVLSYSHYEHRLDGFQNPAGAPAQLVRNVLNVGVSFQVPLYGTWGSPRRPAPARSRPS